MKKGSLAFLLTICVILALMVVALSGTGDDGNVCGKNLIWVYDPDTFTLTISGSGPMRNYPHSTHDQRTHPWAEYDEQIRTIVIEDGVTYLGVCAFCSCTSVTEVSIPASVTTIGANAFWHCTSLSSVTIPRKVSTIGENAFKRCDSLMNITFLGNAPTKVAATAFEGVVANVYFPAQNGSWKEEARQGHGGTLLYHGYQDANHITILTDRGTCGTDTAWTLQDGTLTVSGSGDMEYVLWTALKDQIRQVVIEEGVTSIADTAFSNCSQLSQVQLPTTVTVIGSDAFAGCTDLTGLTIPASVTRIGSQAFADCTALEELRFLGPGPRLADVAVFKNVTASVEYPADQIGWSILRQGLAQTGLRWDGYCSGIHSDTVGTVVQEATCTAFGLTDCQCPICGLEYTVETSPVDHTFLEGLCTVCGYDQPLPPSIQYCYWRDESSIKISWIPVADVEGYELFRTSVSDPTRKDWKCVKNITDITMDSYTNHELSADTSYYYKIRSYRLSPSGRKIYSEFSTVDHPISAVTFEAFYSNAPGRIRLRWQQVEGATGYQVWRMDEDGNYTIVKTIGDIGDQLTNDQGATTSYSNTDLIPGESYTYMVRAFKITQDGRKIFGDYSEPVTITVLSELAAP